MKTLALSESLYRYVLDNGPRPHPALTELIEETRQRPNAGMQISPDQGNFMHLLAKLIGAKRCLEVGTFTGYSAISVALALPEGGKLVSMDVNAETTAVAKRYAEATGVARKIDFRLGPALDTFASLRQEYGVGSFDLAFIDADKGNYDAYYEKSLEMLRPGGLILVDNVLWSGRVLDASDQTPDTEAIRALNRKIAKDERVDAVMLHVADGLYFVRKR